MYQFGIPLGCISVWLFQWLSASLDVALTCSTSSEFRDRRISLRIFAIGS